MSISLILIIFITYDPCYDLNAKCPPQSPVKACSKKMWVMEQVGYWENSIPGYFLPDSLPPICWYVNGYSLLRLL